jgi:hypothetical protein
MEVQRYMLNPFDIILFYIVVACVNNQDICVKVKTLRFNSFTNIYYVEYVYLYTYLVHVCKCILHKGIVDK